MATSLLRRSVAGANCHDYQTMLPDVAASTRPQSLGTQGYAFPHNAGRSELYKYHLSIRIPPATSGLRRKDMRSWGSIQFDPLRHTVTKQISQRKLSRGKGLAFAAASESSSDSSKNGKGRQRTRAKEDVATVREKISNYVEKKSGYFWLGGPIVATAAVFIPPAIVPMVQLLQNNFWAGLFSTFGLDILFVLAADLFFVLADKAGHHQSISGGPSPWVGPWEQIGYPKGEPVLTKLVAYAGVALGVFGIVISFFIGKLAVGLPAFASYLALIFAQVAYERLLSNDKVPVYPLVPILYTVYRFKQLARATELVAVMGGGAPLLFIVKALTVVWTFYLGITVSQLPWLYSTWNSNKAT